jgi:sn-glycerol 3-phosphate transport system ATP-binding protein
MAEINIRNVTKTYGKTTIMAGVNLDIHNGEFVVILGPSGCGKSTLLRLIAGLEEITAGEIAIAGQVVNRLEPRERGCAMVFQNYALYPHMTVAENIGYALKVAGVPRAERLARVAGTAKSVGLSEFLDRRPGQLSGGQRQRVAMARAIIRSPKVFLFDEPLSNLDAKLRVQMRHEIRRIHNQIKATSVFVTHDQHEGMTLADRLVVMNKGTIEQVGTPFEIYERPASLYVAGFIGSPAMNFLPGQHSAARRGVVLEDGAIVPLPEDHGVADGQLVTIGIRPEHAELTAPGHGLFDARLELVEELGAARLCSLRVEDLSFSLLTEARPSVEEGAVLGIGFDARRVHLFDGQTGRRIDARPSAAAAPSPAKVPAETAALPRRASVP